MRKMKAMIYCVLSSILPFNYVYKRNSITYYPLLPFNILLWNLHMQFFALTKIYFVLSNFCTCIGFLILYVKILFIFDFWFSMSNNEYYFPWKHFYYSVLYQLIAMTFYLLHNKSKSQIHISVFVLVFVFIQCILTLL